MSGGGVTFEPGSDLEERIAVVCGHLNALHAHLVALVGEALQSGVWQQIGIRSPAHWLSWKAGISSGHAQRIVALAEAAATHPAVITEFDSGGLSLDQAAVAATVPAYLDERFAELATVSTVAQLRLMARAARDDSPDAAPADEPGPDTSPPPPPAEMLRGWFSEDGRYHLTAELDDDHGRIVDAALSEARDALFQQGHPDVDWPDALVELAQRSLERVEPRERRERFRVNVFLDPSAPIPARWHDRIPIPAWLRGMLDCDATIAPVFTDGARPISVGRTQRTVPDRTRRMVIHRDGGCCRVPWCTQRRWLEVHHVIHHQHGGNTDTDNLASLCGHHHRLHHQGHLGITGNADHPNGLTFTNPAGHPLTAAAHPTKPTTPPPAPAKPYEHPLGGHLDHWSVIFPEPPPWASPTAADT